MRFPRIPWGSLGFLRISRMSSTFLEVPWCSSVFFLLSFPVLGVNWVPQDISVSSLVAIFF